MKWMKTGICVLVCLAVLIVPVWGAFAESGGTPKYGGVLKIIGRRSTTVLGAPFERGLSYPTAAPPVMENLIRMDWEGEPLFVLATSFDIKPEANAIIMGIRKGIKFQDGTPFDAEAVKVNFETKNEKGGVMIREIKSVDVVDDYTVRLNLTKFSTSIFSTMALGSGMMASAKAINTPTTPEKRAEDHMIGTGPFRFVDWERDQYIKYKKFDSYWQKGKPYLDGIEFLYIADPMTALTAFQAGQGHLIYEITPKDASDLRQKGYRITASNVGYGLLVGDGANSNSPFYNQKVREAVEYAIDRKVIADGLGYGYYDALTQPVTNGHRMGYVSGLKTRHYNPEMAKQLLKDAGYPNGFESKIIAQTTDDRDALVAIQNYLGAVRINMKLELVDRGKYYSILREGWQNALIYGRASATPDLAGDFERWYYPRGAFTYAGKMYLPDGFVKLMDDMLVTYEPKKHKELVQKGVRMMHEAACLTPLWAVPNLAASHKSVHSVGWYENALSQHWTPEDAWLDD
ncbi:MAG: ABC transporter substrate-binding protein [Deltaproteobacteria bacterium]|nr:ABC transporter substrate-binding protein [Deltaproteobacteria bacterium]